MSSFRSLDADKILQTSQQLLDRVQERFSTLGLAQVTAEVCKAASEAKERSSKFQRANIPLRIGIGALIVILCAVPIYVFASLRWGSDTLELTNFVQTLEATIATIVFLGVAIVFLVTLEIRLNRQRALNALHELRSLAHIVDMHQLTKSPERILGKSVPLDEPGASMMTAPQLCRYFDYCIELLSVISKIAALYVQDFHDPQTLSAVTQVENLTTDLARQIWQKMMALDLIVDHRVLDPLPSPGLIQTNVEASPESQVAVSQQPKPSD